VQLWDSVVLVPAITETDALGTPRRVPGPDGDVVSAIVQLDGSSEVTTGGQRSVVTGLCFLDAGTVLDAFGYLHWRGELYEVDGEPLPMGGPYGDHHLEVRVRRVR
jgi:hypothetical protein